MLILIPEAFSKPVNSLPVYWLPWSVLKISGQPYFSRASSSASKQNLGSSVFDRRQERTFRLYQSMITVR
ncbi:MAG: hypothetical protein BWX47_02148 [candidate division Hyd24-12 bacterium ADurb.Bin004]|nr:MAG: hypothetical protein BWX47_02148 [candidate division Hyd24-12 bacterium ADurb.Bin004]